MSSDDPLSDRMDMSSIEDFNSLEIYMASLKDQKGETQPGEVVVDTGASKALGSYWAIDRFRKLAEELGYGKATEEVSGLIFRFANGQKEKAPKRVCVPWRLGNKQGTFAVDQLPENM